ncbi:MAG TPA: hypothetical protein ENJ06_05795 [Phycisphaeraceae bacterium]|nr:hypothetical protein [Phycisphaeraceae bacterium]
MSSLSDTPRLKHPLILAHGLLGSDYYGLFGIKIACYFRQIPQRFEQAGNRVMVTRVPATGSIRERAKVLKKQIRSRFADEPVHVIAHSMGGLDARYMISSLNMGEKVISLTTLGTPHRGAFLADFLQPRFRKYGVFSWLHLLGIGTEAANDLRRESCAEFNERNPDHESVRYFSVAGRKDVSRMELLLRVTGRIIEKHAGDNDGLVSVASAGWGERQTIWPCDHLDMVGWSTPCERASRYYCDIRPYYDNILRNLADIECG